MHRRTHRRSAAGFTLIELLVVIAIISILALAATPLLLGSREKAWIAACDDNYFALSSEMQNELDTEARQGNPDAARDVLDRVIPRHQLDMNPRNLFEVAYIDADSCASFVPPIEESCKVYTCFDGGKQILAQQYNVTNRSYRISVD